MDDNREAFLAGERPDDVHAYIAAEAVSDLDALEAHGERVEGGVVFVLDGERARGLFQRTAGIDPMQLASRAMGTDGRVDPDCAGGECPFDPGDADGGSGDVGADESATGDATDDRGGDRHAPRFIFAFAEKQNEAVGGLYAEGDVIHAYVACSCGEYYADKWVVGSR